jgi:hypothetical protein
MTLTNQTLIVDAISKRIDEWLASEEARAGAEPSDRSERWHGAELRS